MRPNHPIGKEESISVSDLELELMLFSVPKKSSQHGTF
jgi:hypothetical protein